MPHADLWALRQGGMSLSTTTPSGASDSSANGYVAEFGFANPHPSASTISISSHVKDE